MLIHYKLGGYIALFVIGLTIRLAAFTINMPFQGDVLTFQIWAVRLFEDGLAYFYYADFFSDYPPMYMYVLWMAGAVRYAFDLEFLSPAFNLVVFTPAIVSDLITGLLIYRVSSSFGRRSFWIALAYLANPAIILNSAVWGQVDAIHTLLLFLALYAVSQKQSLPAYLIYGIAVLTKPQSLIVAPVFLYSAYRAKEPFKMFGYAVATFGLMALLSLPFVPGFDLTLILNQYADTLGSYPFASVNAYNFYALTGGNWQDISGFYLLLSAVAIVGVTLMSFWILHQNWSATSVFFSAALLFIVTFVFVVRMHERYLFPALLFLLVAYIIKNKVHFLALYAAFSATFFINCLDVLLKFNDSRLPFFGESQAGVFRPIDPAIAFISFLHVVLAVYSLGIGWEVKNKKWTDT